MSIAKKLYLLIFSAILGLLILTGLSIYQINKVNAAASYANINTVPSLVELDNARNGWASIRIALWRYLDMTDPAQKSQFEQQMKDEHSKVIAAFEKFEKEDISDETDRTLLQTERGLFAEYEITREKSIALAKAGKEEEAKKLALSIPAVIDKLASTFSEHKKHNIALGKQGAELAGATIKMSSPS